MSCSVLPTKKDDSAIKVGPLSVLQESVTNHTQVLINCRNNKKLLAYVKSFDRHMNLVLENVREMWVEVPRKGKGQGKKPLSHDRYMQKVFLRGDSIILVVRNPLSSN